MDRKIDIYRYRYIDIYNSTTRHLRYSYINLLQSVEIEI